MERDAPKNTKYPIFAATLKKYVPAGNTQDHWIRISPK